MMYVYVKDFEGFCSLRAAAGTTGFRGGDSGHGGRTVIELEDLGSTDIQFKVRPRVRSSGDKLTIMLGGDAELEMIIDVLDFLAATLRQKVNKP